jgi:hypothetical protein
MAKRGQWHEAARIIQAEHPEWSYERIARFLNVSNAGVWKALNPERARELNRQSNAKRNAAKREWDRAHAEDRYDKCECGTRKKKTSSRCDDCVRVAAEARRQLAEGMWADGWTYREIAEAFGVSVDRMAVAVAQWRKQGHADAFPHRRTPEQVARITAGWQRAADARAA